MMNRITLMGRFVRDPELRRTQTGTPITSFTLAVERDFRESDGTKQTDFFDVVVWKQAAEFVTKYFSKGSMIGVDGRLQSRVRQDKEGNRRNVVEIVGDYVYFAGGKKEEYASGKETNFDAIDVDEDSLPF